MILMRLPIFEHDGGFIMASWDNFEEGVECSGDEEGGAAVSARICIDECEALSTRSSSLYNPFQEK
jgi:hypothetical protein